MRSSAILSIVVILIVAISFPLTSTYVRNNGVYDVEIKVGDYIVYNPGSQIGSVGVLLELDGETPNRADTVEIQFLSSMQMKNDTYSKSDGSLLTSQEVWMTGYLRNLLFPNFPDSENNLFYIAPMSIYENLRNKLKVEYSWQVTEPQTADITNASIVSDRRYPNQEEFGHFDGWAPDDIVEVDGKEYGRFSIISYDWTSQVGETVFFMMNAHLNNILPLVVGFCEESEDVRYCYSLVGIVLLTIVKWKYRHMGIAMTAEEKVFLQDDQLLYPAIGNITLNIVDFPSNQ